MKVTIDTTEKTITFHDNVNVEEFLEFIDEGIEMEDYFLRHEKTHQGILKDWKFPIQTEAPVMPYKYYEHNPTTTNPYSDPLKPYCLNSQGGNLYHSGKTLIKG